MPRRLIVNADGFGFAPGVNRGIRDAISGGVVTSVSCNANFPYIEELPALVERFPEVSVGIHLNLSVGKPISPCSEISSLVDAGGEFWRDRFVKRLMTGRISRKHMVAELDAQVRRMHELGVRPTHWDGHQNKHLYPPYFFAAMKVARRHGIRCLRSHRRYLLVRDASRRWKLLCRYYARHPVRMATHLGGRLATALARRRGFKAADRLITPAYADGSMKYHADTWTAVMQLLPPGVNEIYCHPGYPDDVLRAHAKYVDERQREVEVLTSPEIAGAVRDNGVELISFHDL